jgi:hypothetical protein
MAVIPDMSGELPSEDEGRAYEEGRAYVDAEGRRTTDPEKAAEDADSEADRNLEHLERGEVGPGIPED